MHVVEDLRAFLEGGWSLSRTLRDRRSGIVGGFDGIARFVAQRDGLAYHEAGTLRFGAHQDTAEQVHLYDFLAPGRAAIRFRDGRPFHELDLTSGLARVIHHCGADVYRGRYRADDRHTWCVIWAVRGPRKRLLLASRWRRLGSDR